MARIKVDYGVLEQSAQQMKGIASDIENTVNDLKGKLAAVEWEGADKEAYEGQQNEMTQSIHEIKELLENIAGAVNQANDAYQQTESANAQSWG